jgi:Ser/Thr protein kinase RdoA (MazF antagonist)
LWDTYPTTDRQSVSPTHSMLNSASPLPYVLRQFGYRSAELALRSLGNAGGMSGAAIWQVRSVSSRLCLRQWPAEHPSRGHLAWIHRQLSRAAKAGCDFLPIPLLTIDGDTFIQHDGRLWELAAWMPGRADYHQQPSTAKLTAALQALARFHLATSDPATDPVAVSPGLERRGHQIRSLSPQQLSRFAHAIDLRHGPEIERLARRIVQRTPACLQRAAPVVEGASKLRTPLQPCLRDVWHDHVLFEGQRVTGLIDFGAMRVDSPAGDVARLLGSLVRNDPSGWRAGREAYAALRPLTVDQRRMLEAFDAANITLAGINWIRWLFVEGRHFEKLERVERRLTEVCLRLLPGEK